MKKTILSLILLFSLTLFANYDPIIHIPDANFKAKLLAAAAGLPIASTQTPIYHSNSNSWNVSAYHKIDTNNDGEIQLSEALTIKWLDVSFYQSGLQINSLLGIQEFINLWYLKFDNNTINSFNPQNLFNLRFLSFNYCNLNTINFSNNPFLQNLYCDNNQINYLNLENLTSLLDLSCRGSSLNQLIISGLTNLKSVYCSWTSLTDINFEGLVNLEYFDCAHSNFTSLDITFATKLNSLICNNNNLQTLFLKNGVFTSVSMTQNSYLMYICCDESELTYIQNQIPTVLQNNCVVNTYCSFTPGGNFNTITGQLKFDTNQNGCDLNDEPLAFQNLLFSQGTNSGFFSTNNQGQFNAYVGQGTHNIIPQIENPSLFNITPPSAQITFADSNNNTQTQNFCITPNGNQTDVEVIFMPLIPPAVPGFDANYRIVFRNIGNQVVNGEVALTYMSDRIDLVSSSVAPTTQTFEQLIWNYQNLLPFETRTINVTFNINSPMETPPVNNGDLLSYGAYITPLDNDINAFNNTSGLRQEVVGSYDPNDKTCLQGNTPGPEFIGQYVHYLIRFENTGTYFAQNVVIRDDIDLTKFDINSLVILDTSHNMLNTRVSNGNRVEFIFEGIQLPFPPSELRHGYVLFKIKTKANLTVGNTFANQAGIYFDYNHPIITNNETSTFTLLGTPSFEFSEHISLYPNPANEVINISTKADINLKSIEVYNTLGQLLMAVPNDSNERSIDVSHLTSGTYMIKVNTDQGQSHTKFVKK